MSKKIIVTDRAPAPVGPYSQAVEANGFLFISGQIAIDPSSGNLVKDSIEAETRQIMKNIKAILEARGLALENIVDTTIFITDIDFFPAVNKVYGEYFKDGSAPARKTVAVRDLPLEARVEIAAIAVIN
ncbi:MAG: RidA family protein [Chlorobi bacterium]|nr:RidA family protein [Chlorobiota bacterium]